MERKTWPRMHLVGKKWYQLNHLRIHIGAVVEDPHLHAIAAIILKKFMLILHMLNILQLYCDQTYQNEKPIKSNYLKRINRGIWKAIFFHASRIKLILTYTRNKLCGWLNIKIFLKDGRLPLINKSRLSVYIQIHN